MKPIITFLFLISAICISTFAQSRIPEFDKARQIKLLESNRADVKKILADYKFDKADDENLTQEFSTKNAVVEITFSGGDCSDEADETDEWNIPKGKVTKIGISLNEPIKLKDYKFDISEFRKEQKYHDIEDLSVYHNKNLGIAFDVDDGKIKRIYLFPTRSFYASLCENEESEEIKEFYSTESYFGNTKLEDRTGIISCGHPYVSNLILSTNEIKPVCNGKDCQYKNTEISVATEINEFEDDYLIYNYAVSGGRIVGEGKQVFWDLSGVQPGTYTITAGVDDGCGICGETKTKEVVVKECSDCLKKP